MGIIFLEKRKGKRRKREEKGREGKGEREKAKKEGREDKTFYFKDYPTDTKDSLGCRSTH
jgi:hypothetical protein